jgi:hypothetical protein
MCKKIIDEKGVDLVGQTYDVEDEKEVFSSKEVVSLPFVMEETLWWGIANNRDKFEVIAVENDDAVLYNEMGEAHTFFILSADMVT